MQIANDRFDEIARQISSDESPVGIDARKTHVIIIHMLDTIQTRLIDIERRLENLENQK